MDLLTARAMITAHGMSIKYMERQVKRIDEQITILEAQIAEMELQESIKDIPNQSFNEVFREAA